MAKRTVVVMICDRCEKEVEGGMATLVIKDHPDPRISSTTADLCESCVNEVSGQIPHIRQVKKRGRLPAAAAAK